jgi:hypothetical protein
MRFGHPLAAALFTLLAASASAGTDQFDPAAYDKGGFAPVTDATYTKECGGCHFVYLPGLLPARSWQALMAKSNDHFGESLSLAPETARHIQEYLTANAGDHSDYLGAQVMDQRLPKRATPIRITSSSLFKQEHFSILYTIGAVGGWNTRKEFPPQAIRQVMNCDGCHEKAAAGSFALRKIAVPNDRKSPRAGKSY